MAALADPTRRALVERLRDGPLAVTELAAGLLTVTPQGTRRLYAISPDGIAALRRYLDGLWSDALAAFEADDD